MEIFADSNGRRVANIRLTSWVKAKCDYRVSYFAGSTGRGCIDYFTTTLTEIMILMKPLDLNVDRNSFPKITSPNIRNLVGCYCNITKNDIMSYTYLSSIQFQFLLRLKISRGICPFFPINWMNPKSIVSLCSFAWRKVSRKRLWCSIPIVILIYLTHFLENTFGGGGARDKVKHFLGDVSYARDFSRSASVAMTLLFKEKK